MNIFTAAEAWLHQHYLQGDRWWHKYVGSFWWLLAVGVIAALLSVVVQLAYPHDRALPNARLGGVSVGLKNRQQLHDTLDWYGQSGVVAMHSPARSWQEQWQRIGVGIDRQSTADAVLSYSIWERLVPFSGVVRLLRADQIPLVTLIDEDRLDAYTQKILAEDSRAAINAAIVIEKGQARLNPAQNGYTFEVEELKRQIRSAPLRLEGSLALHPKPLPFARGAAEAGEALAAANRILRREVRLEVGGKTFAPSKEEVSGWLQFSVAEGAHTISMQLNRDKIVAYLDKIGKTVVAPPGTATVTLLDGQEVGRTDAPSGRVIDAGKDVGRVIDYLRGDNHAVLQLELVSLPPKVVYQRTYSKSSEGLRAVISDWEAAYGGSYGVIVRELGGQQRYAEWQPDQRFVTASTFKLFVYYAVAQKIQHGQLHYSDKTDMGWIVEDCLEEMIVHSTNPCSISLLNLVGWAEAQQAVQVAGFAATNIDNRDGSEKYSTVRDEANFLLRLQAGTLLGQEESGRLLGYMKRQIWRGGIPSGVPRGVTVADKVGFYNGWVHDVALVYAPGGTYIVAIMSRGGSDPAFAELSRRVYSFFN